MKINSAEFVISNTDYKRCPNPTRPEYAFIGRSNVGKSSLINMLCNRKSLAKTSSTPGKTQLINHYLINEQWFLVDLPGYGYARVGKSLSKSWQKFITDYLQHRENLMNVYVLIDSRHPTQKIDQEFMRWLGEHQIPFSIIFTKTDKLKPHERSVVPEKCKKEMLTYWEEMPTHFMSSAEKAVGRDEILAHIAEINTYFQG
ncbi:MAG: YihA family ribosome biogenesis GTP-binding protein [Crocinitomicaceae bacterium]|nr:YihA family ribosome biogenesis GTP-binding protein [Crocinitomicaceae bacterium]MBK8926209.1 YihA family ribosome biogenesis GTP-binding protein [Crocinitomicaceae bacterium]